ncbi:Chymotrypsin-like elastase member 2A, partial [Halocaridina rubra]
MLSLSVDPERCYIFNILVNTLRGTVLFLSCEYPQLFIFIKDLVTGHESQNENTCASGIHVINSSIKMSTMHRLRYLRLVATLVLILNATISAPHTVGKSCIPKGGGTGECRELFSCPAVVKTFRRERPKLCGFQGIAPIVCCPKPIDSREPPTSRPTITTTGPSTINFECGRRNGRTRPPIRSDVVGGVESSPNSWPWMAALGRVETRGHVTWFCDGVLISPEFVLTAAHCVAYSRTDIVKLGGHNLRIRDAKAVDVGISTTIFHPEYKLASAKHDLAILRLANPVSLSNRISPVCLPWTETDSPDLIGRSLTLTGWGATSFGGPMSNVLREVVVNVFPPEQCDASYSRLRDYTT